MPASPAPFTFPAPGELLPDTLARLRSHAPVTLVELPGGVRAWAVTGHEALAELLAGDHKTVTRNPRHWTALHNGDVPADWPLLPLFQGEHLQVQDGAAHRRLRSLLGRAFTPARAQALAPRIEETAAALLQAMAAAGTEADLVTDFTEPLPIAVICALYGVPAADRAQFRPWAHVLIGHDSTAEQSADAHQAMYAYLAELVERKRREPGDDLTSQLVRVRDENGTLSDTELVANLWLMLMAGHETTVHLLGQAILALCTDPKQRALALSEDRWADVVEETLRRHPPFQASPFRYALTDLTLAGVDIAAGDALLVGYGGAGTDPARYGPRADHFDLTREQTGHLSFGHGPHYCIGAQLARLEGRIALSALFTRFPDLQLTLTLDQIPYSPSFITYGPLSLPTRLAPTPASAATRN
ncbi:cytochrome P450 [Streptomyces sp. QH1-20]|uniref:cytochrome P450 family protein n=1 Tax=Streptomyces sp. QH1-20 TaxID=3240934 RepID=UPI003514BAE4